MNDVQQECPCGWLAPREAYVELLYETEKPPDQLIIIVICPVCGTRFDRVIKRSRTA